MKKLGIAIIGCGNIAPAHLEGYARLSQICEVRALCDLYTDKATRLAKRFDLEGCTITADYHDLLDRSDIDVVSLCLPPSVHCQGAVGFLGAGKHVIVEKPMATTLEDADALISACRKAGVICSSKEGSVRYQPATARAKELIDAGAIGEVMATQVFGAANKPDSYWTGGYSGRVQTTWRKSKMESGGGILLMNYIYDIYRLRYLTGLEVTRVYAEFDTYRTQVEVEDFIAVTLRYTNGALGTFMAGSCAPGASKSGMRGTRAVGNRIFGTAGQIVFEDSGLLVYTDNDVAGLTKGDWTELPFSESFADQSYVTYFDRFSEAIAEGAPVDIPCEEGRKDLEVFLAAYRSGETYLPVALPMTVGQERNTLFWGE